MGLVKIPKINQFFGFNSILLQIGLLPTWIAPVQPRSFFITNKYETLYHRLKSDVVAFVTPSKITYLVADADLAKDITTNRVEDFPKPIHNYKVVNIFGTNVVSTEHTIWKRHRKIASAGFTERNNRLVFTETRKFTFNLIEELNALSKSSNETGTIDVVSYMLKVALCVISSSSFGIDCDWDTHDTLDEGCKMTFFAALEEITSRPVPLVLLPRWALKIPIFNLPRLSIAIEEYQKYITKKLKAERLKISEEKKNDNAGDNKKKEDRRGDLFSSLIATSDGGRGDELTLSDDELMGNIYILMLAGHETSAHTLAFALGLLACNPQIQEDFYQEIESVVGSDTEKDMEYEHLINLKLGLAIMNETLRLYPIVTVIPKWAPKNTHLGQGDKAIFIPAQSQVNLHVNGIHHNPKYWKDPLRFNPSRFLGEYNKDAFLPFSDGIRSCIGKRFAQIESITVLTLLVRSFVITSEVKDTEVLLEPTSLLTLVPKNKVMLKFTPRKKP